MTAALRRVRGVVRVHVDRRSNEAVVSRREGTAPDRELLNAVRRTGYSASIIPTTSVTLAVPGMGCRGCPERVSSAITGVRGVRRVVLSRGEAVVQYDTRRATTERIVAAVKRSGFDCKPRS